MVRPTVLVGNTQIHVARGGEGTLRQRGGRMGAAESVGAIGDVARRPPKQRVFLSNSINSAARRQRGGRVGAGERVGLAEAWPAARSSSAGV